VEITAIVSNHTDFYQISASYNTLFHHLPLVPGSGVVVTEHRVAIDRVTREDRGGAKQIKQATVIR
jgi:formyltetrahydrofolate hydrolase